MLEISVYVDIMMKMLIIIKAMIKMNSVEKLLSLQELEKYKYII